MHMYSGSFVVEAGFLFCQLVSSKEVGEWPHVSKSFQLPPFQKTKYFIGVYYSHKFTNYMPLTAVFISNQGVLSP